MTEKKHAIVILETVKDDEENYIPCIVKEDEQGYYPTDWEWGTNLDDAIELAHDYNNRLGLTPKEAYSIVLQSMRPAADSSPYQGTAQNMAALADEYDIDPAAFIYLWKERFPEHGPAYMTDWARRIKNRETGNYSDPRTLQVLAKCNLDDDRP